MNTQYDPARQYRQWYKKLLRLYSKSYHERFGEGMEQTFNDLLQERAEEEKGVFGCAFWMFTETFTGIIREKIRIVTMQTKNITVIVLATVVILSLPLLAMQVTDEVNWDVVDFAFAGTLIIGTGVLYDITVRKTGNTAYRAAVGAALAAAFILIWLSGAIGIIGPEGNPLNLMCGGVLAVAIASSFTARFQPQGMARALSATALAQIFIIAIALVVGFGSTWWDLARSVLLNGFLVMLWGASAVLFHRAAQERPTANAGQA